MQHKQKRLKIKSGKLKVIRAIALLVLSSSLFTVSAQESFNGSGGEAIGTRGSASYSVGQLVYTTHTGSTGSVAQGVQQPYEISIVLGVSKAKAIQLSISAYPNPTTDYLILSVDKFDISKLSYQLYDISGKLLIDEKITNKETSIAMSSLLPSNYFVRVIQENKEIKTFKIIKN